MGGGTYKFWIFMLFGKMGYSKNSEVLGSPEKHEIQKKGTFEKFGRTWKFKFFMLSGRKETFEN